MSYLPLLYYGTDDQSVSQQYSAHQETNGGNERDNRDLLSSIDPSSSSTGRAANYDDSEEYKHQASSSREGSSSSSPYKRPTDDYYDELSAELEKLTAGVGLFPESSSAHYDRQEEGETGESFSRTEQKNSMHDSASPSATNDLHGGIREHRFGSHSLNSSTSAATGSLQELAAAMKKPPRRAPPPTPNSKKKSKETQISQETSTPASGNSASQSPAGDKAGKSHFVDRYYHPGRFIRGDQESTKSQKKDVKQKIDGYSGTREAADSKDKESGLQQVLHRNAKSSPRGSERKHNQELAVQELGTAARQGGDQIVPISTEFSTEGVTTVNDSGKRETTVPSRQVRVRPPPEITQLATAARSNQRKKTGASERAGRRSRSVEPRDRRGTSTRRRKSLTSRIQHERATHSNRKSSVGGADVLRKLLDATKAELNRYRQQLGDKTENARLAEERANALEKLVKNLSSGTQSKLTENEVQQISPDAHPVSDLIGRYPESEGNDGSARSPPYQPSIDASANLSNEQTRYHSAPSAKSPAEAASTQKRDAEGRIVPSQTNALTTQSGSVQAPMKSRELLSGSVSYESGPSPISIQKEIRTFSRSNKRRQQETGKYTSLAENQTRPAPGMMNQPNYSTIVAASSGQQNSSRAYDIVSNTSEAMKYLSRRDVSPKQEEKTYSRDSVAIFRRVYGDVDSVYPGAASAQFEGTDSTARSKNATVSRNGGESDNMLNEGSRRAPTNIPLNVHLDKTSQGVTPFPRVDDEEQRPTLTLANRQQNLQTNKERFLEIAGRLSPSTPASSRPASSDRTGSSRSTGRGRRHRSASPRQPSPMAQQASYSFHTQDPELYNLLPEKEYRALCAMARSAWSSSKR
eukprot:gb/GECG01007585.1/.p1 GENE.gb/GECG01007585.1/~~gb/GECG01007585.1/.p1  ORF type:complete len:865 (+),score=131.84 gb/GECG01007585.1/:1-2595(+)